ncbi:ketoacyl-ACP synthase III [Herbiconiux sp. CPCC 203407]|uniref:Ketoacyl-ACP synthase III n=1 Tax=Herbiconiux oxytropis TaxID=2970915 RepID=A0AA42BVC0_9MICO|nr:3-oxoacyl-[acyl-carrier-protein] synthase III C-terminal domain-containing protein [Herbiconiux oxytropis]MCS5721272.1 ketoacyl-ACP synthase III [Herbiconiux oxytropis]MCS5726289.1 ketoacyl-ACP synthase III [Herbiconiux oxytropis]
MRARIAAVASHLPPETRSTVETEERLRRENPGLHLATGLIGRLTGVERVHLRPDGWQTSDLAVAAARTALERSPGAIDLLIFASASQDLIEPATSHIVSAKLGLDCPVLDVKNACNSVLNAMQVAEALIATGQYRRVLIASGEQPSHAVRWRLDSQAQFLRSFAGYTMSDAGAAVILEAGDPETTDVAPGILGSRFVARSEHWAVGTLPTGGSVNPHAQGGSYFDMDGGALQRAFAELGVGLVQETLASLGFGVDQLDFVAVHQVALAYHETISGVLGLDSDRTVVTIARHGNLASATLPLQLELALASGTVGPGSLVGLVGLAGGISLGAMVVRL